MLARTLNGHTAQQIVREAFPGSQLQQRPPTTIKVLIADQAPSVVMSGQTVLRLVDEGRKGATGTLVPIGHRIIVQRSRTAFTVTDLDQPGARPSMMRGPVRMDSGDAETGIRMATPLDRRFRGTLRVTKSDGLKVAVVNQTTTEDYIRGVLAGDMPPEWGDRAPVALVVGAVAARSRALAAVATRKGAFNVTSDDPLYLGLDGERPQTNAAVDGSTGWTVTLANHPFEASFPVIPGDVTVFAPTLGAPDQVAAGPNTRVPGWRPGLGGAAVQMTMGFRGTPYRWGGSKPGGFDCSGLLYFVYGKLGMRLPRVAEDQAHVGTYVPWANLLPGDAVFFADSSGYIHHMGLYIGGGKMVHAPQTGDVVKVSAITTGHYAEQFAGGRRYSP
ncbi:MAG: hypothetical protein EXQ74_01630 [Thermoleophilia bacterium]|nr:hypothetical protein [Thermoleophilia bacterium]